MRRAVVVGCSQYRDPRIGPLRFAHLDADQFAQAVTRYCGVAPADVARCASPGDRPADRAGIMTALVELSARPADVVFFFFSGHGFRGPDGRDYLLPHDAIAAHLTYNAIALDDVAAMLEKCRARCAVLILDACRNVTGTGKSADDAAPLEPIDPGQLRVKGVAAFFSCRPSERSYESDGLSGGVFTRALLDGLGDAGHCRTVRELDAYLARRVVEIGRAQGRPLQNPVVRVEPLTMADVSVVSRERLTQLSAQLRLGRERRAVVTWSVAPESARISSGIASLDIGSSNSLCTFPTDEGDVHFIRNAAGRRHTPSAVLVWPGMDYEVGLAAIDHASNPTATLLRHFKRLVPCAGTLSAHGRDIAATDLVTATTVSLLRDAEEALGHEVRQALAAVPASFGLRARDDFAAAIAASGVSLKRLISEPCAAALCAFHDLGALQAIGTGPLDDLGVLVVDVGGGTTDVAAVMVSQVDDQVQIEVQGVHGIAGVGGVDFDAAILALIRERLRVQAAAAGVVMDLHAETQLGPEAERVKIRLGVVDQASVVLSGLESAHGLRDLETVVTRDVVAAATESLVAQIERCMQAAAASARQYRGNTVIRGWDAINVVVLAGLGCKIWPVRRLIDRLAEQRHVVTKHEEAAVAVGLARYAAVLGGSNPNLLLLDALTSSITLDCERVGSPADGDGDDDRATAIVSSAMSDNKIACEVLDAQGHIPTKRSLAIHLRGPDPVHTLVFSETTSDGLRAPLLRVEATVVDDSRWLQITIDVGTDTTVVLELAFDGRPTGTARRWLLGGRHSDGGRRAIEAGVEAPELVADVRVARI